MGTLAINGGTPLRKEPFPGWPFWDETELEAVQEVVKSGKWGMLQGKKVKEFEEKFAAYQDARYGICVTSGSVALRIALQSLGIGPGDEVILPAYTFIASASAVIEVNAVPIFVDIDPQTYNIDPQKVKEAISEKTKAIMPVHIGGRPASMGTLLEIAERHRVKIIEDAAQAWGSEWRGRKVGAIGDIGTVSFQSSKNITSGEGGIILTNDENLAETCRSLSNCGRLEGGIWYEHYLLGGNYRLSEFQGAILLAQLSRYEEHKKKREENAHYLAERLGNIEGIEPLLDGEDVTSNAYHLFIFKYHKEHFQEAPKEKFVAALRAEGITLLHGGYSLPLYKQPVMRDQAFGPHRCLLEHYGKELDYSRCYCPETEKACSEEAIWVQQSLLLGTREDLDSVVEAIKKIKAHAEELID